ncbi:MAG: hypothetical protein V1697_03275 [Candidatus Levyibacteriota bacterium]
MNSSINLLQQKDEHLIKKRKKVKILRTTAGILLGLVAAFSIIIFILNIQFSVSSIKKEQNSVINSISALKEKAAKLILVNDRIKGISEILNKRKNYSNLIEAVLESVPGETKVTSLELNKETVKTTIASKSLLSINSFLDIMIQHSQRKKIINNLTIKGINVNTRTGEYSLSISAVIL